MDFKKHVTILRTNGIYPSVLRTYKIIEIKTEVYYRSLVVRTVVEDEPEIKIQYRIFNEMKLELGYKAKRKGQTFQ